MSETPQRGPSTRGALETVRLIRPYSFLWFVAVPVTTMAVWLRGHDLQVLELVGLIAALALADTGLTTWNDICDRETDRASSEEQRRNRPLASGAVTVRAATVQVVVFECIAMAVAVVVSPWLALMIAGGILYGFAYAVRPLDARGRPLISQGFWLILWPGLYVAVALVLGGDLERGWIYVLGNVAFMGFAETLAKDIRDLDNDAATGKRTVPGAIGLARASRASLAGFVLGALVWVLASALVKPWNPGLTAALAVVLAPWLWSALRLTGQLAHAYSKDAARDLHMGAIRIFLAVNAIFLAGLPASPE
jgi:4-hydroxybenzoate polyprenyltransferase